jgi:2-polyprenyl-3-methyl-5-hydroxy-6-metoxy-1,4-benzoquinol methylase
MALLKHMYADKGGEYFSTANTGILPLLPRSADRILDIGCGEGATLSWVKQTLHAKWTVGVELDEKSARIAAGKIDQVWQGDIETLELPFGENSFDLILCLDVLEHLVDPWSVVGKLASMLASGGSLIASVPNVRHHSVVLPLLLHGTWAYAEKDILDRTHLRFFTRRSAVELFQRGGMTVDEVVTASLAVGSKSWLFNLFSFGLLRHFFVFQYLLRATKHTASQNALNRWPGGD